MQPFKVIAFTHRNLPLEAIGKLHLDDLAMEETLPPFKRSFQFSELLYLSTCNRSEFFIRCEQWVNEGFIKAMVLSLSPGLSEEEAEIMAKAAEVFEGEKAVEHVLRVASSLDSLVVGEREIITQVRKAYDKCNSLGLTGDFIRILIRHTVETAKEIYTNTAIARNPVSVASLAYRQLRQLGIKDEARIVFVGSGQTNSILAGYFKKHRFANFTIFNRTKANAEKLAEKLGGKALPLSDIETFKEGFDVLVVCTGSQEPIISETIFRSLNMAETSKKVIIDLGVPANVEAAVSQNRHVHYIDINSLRRQAEINLQSRKEEIGLCEEIIGKKTEQFKVLEQERKIERAFGAVPLKVKAIREQALGEVFAKEVNTLDSQSKEVLDKVLAYMEKKYNAVAIKTAKEVFRSPDL